MRAVALTKTKPKNISYNAAKAQLVKQELPFVDVTWVPSESDRSGIVALEGHRETILEMMDVHGRRHPLIPAAKDAYWNRMKSISKARRSSIDTATNTTFVMLEHTSF